LTAPWGLLVQRASQALLEGRFRECDRLLADAAGHHPADPAPGLLAAICRREQGRASEAEVLARSLVVAHPDAHEGHALLGAVLADLGRDAEARRQLDLLDPSHASPAVLALAAETAAALDAPGPAEALYEPLAARIAADPGAFAGCHGSVARHLGLVCHVLGRWDEAEVHFRTALDANHAVGAPVLVAHTRRHYSALLRARGGAGDWERAIDLLSEAADIYRRLEIDRLAEEAGAVLRRSQDPVSPDAPGSRAVNVFRRTATGWEVAFGGRRAEIADAPGLDHIAALLAAEGRPVHVADLVDGAGPALAHGVAAEYRARRVELGAQLTGPDPVAAALARAERDMLDTELLAVLAGRTGPADGPTPAGAGDPGDGARRLVALRVRIGLDRLEEAVPDLAGHLRRSIRTGMFCLYDPEGPERWKIR
jgi:tetratricopeptide (TPR) repeat protein